MGSPPQDEYSHGVKPVRSREDYPLIGSRWKRGDMWSRAVLTDRGLDLYFFLSLYAVLMVQTKNHFLVSLALWFHFDSIPNSTVKRSCGDDTLGVASWDNSSMPRLLLKNNAFLTTMGRVFAFLYHTQSDGLWVANTSYWSGLLIGSDRLHNFFKIFDAGFEVFDNVIG